MKKFYILLLALVIAAFAVPAMAGDVSVSGYLEMDGETRSTNDGRDKAFYDSEIGVTVELEEGPVTFAWDILIEDDEEYDGDDPGEVESDDFDQTAFDGFDVTWQVNDALYLSFNDGGFDYGWDGPIGIDGPNNKNIEVGYSLEVVDLTLILSKLDEGLYAEDDDDMIIVSASFNIEALDTLEFHYVDQSNDLSGADDCSQIGVVAGFGLGPVGLDLEYSQHSSDDDALDGGTYFLVGVDLGDIVGFGLNLTYYQSNEEWGAGFGEDYDAMKIYSGGDTGDTMWLRIGASYKYSDKLSFGAAILPMGDVEDDDIGTEIDVKASYQIADNVKYSAGYATWSPGDWAGDDDDTYTKLWHRLNLDF